MVNENASSAAGVLALVDDLFFQAKMVETARQVGVPLHTVSNGAALIEALKPVAGDGNSGDASHKSPRLIVIDLNARQGAMDALEQLRRSGNSVPIIGFLSHVQTELADRARAAGCTRVIPRSTFTMNLAEILRQGKT